MWNGSASCSDSAAYWLWTRVSIFFILNVVIFVLKSTMATLNHRKKTENFKINWLKEQAYAAERLSTILEKRSRRKGGCGVLEGKYPSAAFDGAAGCWHWLTVEIRDGWDTETDSLNCRCFPKQIKSTETLWYWFRWTAFFCHENKSIEDGHWRIIQLIWAFKVITESQNLRPVRVGKDFWRSSSPRCQDSGT